MGRNILGFSGCLRFCFFFEIGFLSSDFLVWRLFLGTSSLDGGFINCDDRCSWFRIGRLGQRCLGRRSLLDRSCPTR